MLHILWMILKILLIMIGIILGLVLLLVLLLLFCPVRYKVHAAKEEEASLTDVRADGMVSWLFGGAAVGVTYQDRNTDISVRLFGIPVDKLLSRGKDKKAETGEEDVFLPDVPRTETEEPAGSASGSIAEEISAEKTEEVKPEAPEEKNSEIHVDETTSVPSPEEITEKTAEVPETVKEETFPAEVPEAETVVTEEEKESLFEKIGSRIEKLKEKLQQVRDKVHAICTQITWWRDFIFHERTQAAIRMVFREMHGLIRHVLPTRMYGDLAYGFEDPSLTGRLTGALAMSIPFHKNQIVFSPSFECRSFVKGDVTVKGRISGIAFVAAGIRLILSKNIRFVIGKVRNRKKEDNHKEE